MQFMLSNSIMI